MTRKILAGLALALTTPAMADAKPPTTQHRTTYLHLYRQARQSFGKRAPGCKLIGPHRSCQITPTDAKLTRSIAVLARMLAPPPTLTSTPLPESAPGSMSATSTATPAQLGSAPPSPAGSTSGALPACTWQPESGGNWNAVNPSSGAYGYYQILPSTAAAYGCDLSSHQGQTDCAQTIYKQQGPSAWVGC